MEFDKVEFVRNFYIYIKDRYGDYTGSYDELYDIYSLDYCNMLIENNSTEKNKSIAEYFGTCETDDTDISPESYNIYANYAYGFLWNTIMKEFDLCEYSDAETDSD